MPANDPPFKKGERPSARKLNAIAEGVDRKTVISSPDVLVGRGRGGQTVDLLARPAALAVSWARSGDDGIDAMSGDTPGSGEITLYGWPGTAIVAGDAATGYNPNVSQAVGPNKTLIVIQIAGRWVVIFESCG